MRHAFPVLLAVAVAAPAAAQDIYKCVSGGSVAYQSMPCAAGEAQTRLDVGPMVPKVDAQIVPAPRVAPPTAPSVNGSRPVVGRPLPWRNRTLTLGMSDDEVLNMPQWGRPSHIARTRMPRGWQEVWTYNNLAAGERQLTFVNARLADIVDAPAQVAQATLQ